MAKMKKKFKHKFQYLIGLEIQETVNIECDEENLSDEIAVKTFLEHHIPMFVGTKDITPVDIVDRWFLENVKVWKRTKLN